MGPTTIHRTLDFQYNLVTKYIHQHTYVHTQVRTAEASYASPATNGVEGVDVTAVRPPPYLGTQLNALLRRSALNVARDPYLAGLHVVLTVCVGLVVGLLFRDLGRLNEETAGVQVRGWAKMRGCGRGAANCGDNAGIEHLTVLSQVIRSVILRYVMNRTPLTFLR